MKFLLILILSFGITGCASFGKGIVEGLLEKDENDIPLLCEIVGKGFDGIEPSVIHELGKTKLLKIHGVGDHAPGYSTEFLEKLAIELDMPVRNSDYKEFPLINSRFPGKKLGVLRITRLLNVTETKELLFYELTWSEITAKEKAELEYDTSGEYSYDALKLTGF